MVSLDKITKNGKAIFLAYDQGLELGPDDVGQIAIDPNFILQIAEQGGYNGIILQKGIAEKYYSKEKYQVPLILKLNGKTELSSGDPISRQVCSVKEALSLGAAAVGYTIYIGSEHESIMMAEFGKIVEQARPLKLPVIAWCYPRGKSINNTAEAAPDNVIYAARVGLELGADIVKIKYCGSQSCFARAVKAAGKTKVMMAGGPKVNEKKFLERVRNVMAAGAIGIVAGRNVWLDKEPLKITEEIKKIVFN
ncbi:aldolase [Patescibacteria group bacterium]|nr:aldolase [Patescibacteria group bacterium]